MMPSIKEQLSKKIEKIEQTIDFYLPEEKGLQKTVLSAMNYSVKAGGNRAFYGCHRNDSYVLVDT